MTKNLKETGAEKPKNEIDNFAGEGFGDRLQDVFKDLQSPEFFENLTKAFTEFVKGIKPILESLGLNLDSINNSPNQSPKSGSEQAEQETVGEYKKMEFPDAKPPYIAFVPPNVNPNAEPKLYFHGATRKTPPSFNEFGNKLSANMPTKGNQIVIAPYGGKGSGGTINQIPAIISNLSEQLGIKINKDKFDAECHSYGFVNLMSLTEKLPKSVKAYDPVCHKQQAETLLANLNNGAYPDGITIYYGAIPKNQTGIPLIAEGLGGKLDDKGNFTSKDGKVKIIKMADGVNHASSLQYMKSDTAIA